MSIANMAWPCISAQIAAVRISSLRTHPRSVCDRLWQGRPLKAVDLLRAQWPTVLLVHTPIHASWLNQIEIYFSIVQRKVLTPNDFKSLNELEQRLLAFGRRYEETASPFQWTFTRKDLT